MKIRLINGSEYALAASLALGLGEHLVGRTLEHTPPKSWTREGGLEAAGPDQEVSHTQRARYSAVRAADGAAMARIGRGSSLAMSSPPITTRPDTTMSGGRSGSMLPDRPSRTPPIVGCTSICTLQLGGMTSSTPHITASMSSRDGPCQFGVPQVEQQAALDHQEGTLSLA